MPYGSRNENRLDWSWIEGRRRAERLGNDNALPTLGGGSCWCGEEHGHDWPGKDDGAPHPREK